MNLDYILPETYRLSDDIKERLLTLISKIIFTKNETCPHCFSQNVIKHGKFKGKQRYLCNCCSKTFNDNTNSPIYNSKKPRELWMDFARCMISRISLRKSAKLVGIDTTTAFFWRHKILEAVKISMSVDPIQGVVEADEIFLRLNFKGNHKKITMPRLAHQTGEKCKMNISKEKVCIAGAMDNGGSIIMDLMCLGAISHDKLTSFYNGLVAAGSVLCTDCHMSYVKFAENLKLKHKRIIIGDYNIKPYTIKHIKALQGKMMMWLRGFKGVATKYLSNYLSLFKLIQNVTSGTISKWQSMFPKPNMRIFDIKSKPAIPV